ncbi:MAG: PepSY domain-containing protein [Halioglobus sp.]|nr:PepSY domain-containing protein [Halioglobus sp.]
MKPTVKLFFFTWLYSLGFNAATAGDIPPQNSLPLSKVVTALEKKGFTPITEISMDDNVWQVEAFISGDERALTVDPTTAEILSDQPAH